MRADKYFSWNSASGRPIFRAKIPMDGTRISWPGVANPSGILCWITRQYLKPSQFLAKALPWIISRFFLRICRDNVGGIPTVNPGTMNGTTTHCL
jgi:hypothetical protein